MVGNVGTGWNSEERFRMVSNSGEWWDIGWVWRGMGGNSGEL